MISWYDPVVDAFRKHLEDDHPDMDNALEIRIFEEELHYGEQRDGEEHECGCAWVGCTWRIKFQVAVILDGGIDESKAA